MRESLVSLIRKHNLIDRFGFCCYLSFRKAERFFHKNVRLLKSGEMATALSLVPVDEIGIGLITPAQNEALQIKTNYHQTRTYSMNSSSFRVDFYMRQGISVRVDFYVKQQGI